MLPLVSVIIPVHNGEKYLPQAIESVLRQDYARHEIWIIDNGSTDGTRQAAARYPQAHYDYSETADVNLARNRGLVLAEGEYIAFLDADDTWLPQKLSRQVGFLQSRPEYGAVVGLQKIYLEEGCAKPHWLKRSFLESPRPGYLPSALLARRSAFQITGDFDTAYSLSSDADWFFKARHGGIRVGLIEEVVIHRRIHGDNVSARFRGMQQELLAVIKSSLDKRRNTEKPCRA
jgi:glycosyltransferase involved in cell wall biosynthesis